MPRVRSGVGQTLLSSPDLVDQIKRDMLAGEYDYESSRGRIAGWRDQRKTYYIGEGHHRMAAALEVFRETGDHSHVMRLIENGQWEPSPPPRNRRLPRRGFWSRLLHKMGL